MLIVCLSFFFLSCCWCTFCLGFANEDANTTEGNKSCFYFSSCSRWNFFSVLVRITSLLQSKLLLCEKKRSESLGRREGTQVGSFSPRMAEMFLFIYFLSNAEANLKQTRWRGRGHVAPDADEISAIEPARRCRQPNEEEKQQQSSKPVHNEACTSPIKGHTLHTLQLAVGWHVKGKSYEAYGEGRVIWS